MPDRDRKNITDPVVIITRNLQGALMMGISNHVQVNTGSVKKFYVEQKKHSSTIF